MRRRFEIEPKRFPSPDGPLHYAAVPWDSETYGFPFTELKHLDVTPLSALRDELPGLLRRLDHCTVDSPHLLFCKTALSAVETGRILVANGFYPVETMLEVHLSLERFTPPIARAIGGLSLRPATENDLPRLAELAAASFHADRLHVDPNLPRDKADLRFANWVSNGVRDGELVLCYDDSRGNTVGFYHVRDLGQGKVDLSLAAVDPAKQKLGIGLLMYQATLLLCKSRGYSIAESNISVNNVDVLNLFSRLGFSFRVPRITYHRYRP